MLAAFLLDSRLSEQTALAGLQEAFATAHEPPFSRELTYFDTFDWRLLRHGESLCSWESDGRTMFAWEDADGRPLHRAVVDRAPAFSRDLPEGAFRAALANRIDTRRLLAVVRLELHGRALRVLDDNGKTVAAAVVERGLARAPGSPGPKRRLPRSLSVVSIRGYEKQGRRLARFIEQRLGLPPAEPSVLIRALEAIGRRPQPAPGGSKLRLDPRMPAAAAGREVLARQFEAMSRNEPGMRENLDSEFLHDFRVAVRRTRSALGQIKGVLPPDDVARFREEFRWLGELTGPARDIDVYLLRMPEYRSALPEELRPALDPLERWLERRQAEEYARLVAGLDSPRYVRLRSDWRAFLDRGVDELRPAKNAAKPVRDVASRRIRKAFRGVVDLGSGIGPDAPAELLHRLRIQCKKLRYLLEFFRSLYDPGTVESLVRSLKNLQDHLGDFNDLEVQQHSLADAARAMVAEGDAAEAGRAAIERLIAGLRARQLELRQRFRADFDRFVSAKNRKRFKGLFQAEADAT